MFQFPLPHSRGSSHGQSRITRKAYGPKEFYTNMMEESYRIQDELQAECGEQLFVVVLALGAWAAKFLPRIGVHVPLEPLKITVCYWEEKNGDHYSTEDFPAFMSESGAGNNHIYELPSKEYPGLVKICLHHGPKIDSDNRDAVDNEWVLDTIKMIIRTHFPTLENEPSVVETCIYTVSPYTDFVLDVHPSWKNVVIAAGFSGHGFKLAPVVGKVLAQLATEQQPSYDMSHFKIDRFFKNKL
ncbi:peroxisomal sarcosine oxidase-like [Mercenaria mercenaria]|uniref:peroxisomal sarcosine oxidase-like n=1 Tax=Mercenaria mercenaria TaxID=6596 RepID=UPI00234E71C4|nr:peroxisomal sarcosine oxidase-like [Mercenaria mercenaria]